jgi:methylmalonyl-CoA/ethylmalonyl-CoA epimerase
MPQPVKFDHLALGVETWADGYDPLVTQFGGRWSHGGDAGEFVVCQLIYQHDMRLELIAPSPTRPNGFMRRFIDQDGPGPHHLTFKVPSLDEALDSVAELGIGTLGGRTEMPFWREAFLHPKAAGVGTLLQLAQVDDEFLQKQLSKSVAPDDFPTGPDHSAEVSWIGLTVESLARSEEIFLRVLGGETVERDRDWMLVRWRTGHSLLIREPAAQPHPALTWKPAGATGIGHVLFGSATLGVKELDDHRLESTNPGPLVGVTLTTAITS